MHHSQLEYLQAIQCLEGKDKCGVKGAALAEYMEVSPSYVVKLTKHAEENGYICRGKSRTVCLTKRGRAVLADYVRAINALGGLFALCGLNEDMAKAAALKSVCAVDENTRKTFAKQCGNFLPVGSHMQT